MLEIYNVLSRADEITIQKLLGTQTIKILNIISDEFTYNSRLKELIKDLQGKDNLLIDHNYRNMIFDLLKPNEAKNLSVILGTYKENIEMTEIYDSLKSKRITRGSNDERELFTFFNLTPPPLEEKPEQIECTDQQGNYQLFKHQRIAAYNIREQLTTTPKKALLHMPTGAGKTRTAMNIVSDHFRNNEPSVVIWLAASEELCEQAVEEFEKAWGFLGNRELRVHRFWGGRNLDPLSIDEGFIVAGLPKMVSTAKKSGGHQFIADLAKKVSLIIIDEAHQSVANTYKFILESLYNFDHDKQLLGLSATPGRTYDDIEQDRELANFFSKKKVILEVEGYENPVEYLVDQGYISKVNYVQLTHSGNTFTEKDFSNLNEIPKAVLNKVGEDEQRNLKIVYEAKRLAESHKRIIIFAPSVDASDSIAFVLRILGYKSYSLTGNTSTYNRKSIINDFKNDDTEPKILCNYGVLTTGFDAPKTSAAIIARPTVSLVLYSQMIGRAIRGLKAGGNREAEIVTVIDQGLPGFRSVAESFINWEDVWK